MKPQWNYDELTRPPRTFDAPNFSAPGVEALFFENEPYQGNPTRVFSWMGVPYRAGDEKCPAMVLLHGGGGTAFDEWVRIWNRRGYAAITFDQCGCVPGQPQARHARGGPPGWDASFDQIDEDIEQQWQYHAVTAAFRAHSLIASHPAVDENRIGLTGISWGGYMTCLVAGTDPRYKCAIPVYGCGFLGENSVWKETTFPQQNPRRVKAWLEAWDPSGFLPKTRIPFCWVSGTNDLAYPLDSLQKSYRLTPDRSLCIRVGMPHSHPDGWAPEEIGVFADSMLKKGTPPAKITGFRTEGSRLVAAFESARPIMRADVCYTRATGYWSDRKYNLLPADIDAESRRVIAEIPPHTTVCFLNLFDDGDCATSTEHIEFL